MPVLDHEVSAMTRRTDADPYYCKDKPRTRDDYQVQDGWTEDGRRNMVWIKSFGSINCMYDQSLSDKRCNCIHGGTGEENDRMIRSKEK